MLFLFISNPSNVFDCSALSIEIGYFILIKTFSGISSTDKFNLPALTLYPLFSSCLFKLSTQDSIQGLIDLFITDSTCCINYGS